MDLATSGKGGVGPYVGICAIVGCFGVADANVEGGMIGDLSFMHPELIQVSSAQCFLTYFPFFFLFFFPSGNPIAILIRDVTMFCSPSLLAWLHQGL